MSFLAFLVAILNKKNLIIIRLVINYISIEIDIFDT